MNSTRLPLVLAGAAVAAGVAAFLTPFAAGAFAPWSAGILALPAALLGLGLAFLLLSRRTRAIVIPLFLLGMAAAAVTFASWSVGFDEADAGGPRSFFGTLFIPAAITTAVLLAAAAGIAVASVLRMRPVPRALLAGAVGLLSVPFVFPLIVSAPTVTIAALAMMLVLVLRGRGQTREARPRTSAGRGVRVLALVSFLITLAALAYGLIGGVALAGTDAATRAIGIMAAGGNLAAVPLMAALTQPAVPGRVWPRVGLLVGSVGVTLGSIAWAAGFDLSQGSFLAIPVFVGLWAGTVAAGLVPYTGGARIGISVLLGLGTTIAYFMLVLSLAGASLAVISGFLAFGGSRLLSKTKEIDAEMAV